MIHRVEFSPTAEAEMIEAALCIAQDAPLNAERWLSGMQAAIMSLAQMPRRCSLARESEALGIEVRQRVYKSHRILFTVESDVVRIHRIVHTARRSLDSYEELQGG